MAKQSVDALSLKDFHLGLENYVYCQETQVGTRDATIIDFVGTIIV